MISRAGHVTDEEVTLRHAAWRGGKPLANGDVEKRVLSEKELALLQERCCTAALVHHAAIRCARVESGTEAALNHLGQAVQPWATLGLAK